MLCGLPMRKLGAVVGSPLPAPCTPPQGLALAAGPAARGGGCRGDDASSPRLCSPRGLEVAFFGREASRRAHVGCGDETGGGRRRRCDCGACAKELPWPPLPSCLAWGLPSLPTAPLHQDRGSYLTITPSLCAWNSQPKSQAFPGLAFQRTPGTLTKGRDEKSVLFLQMQIPAESPACSRHRGGCGQAGAVSACLSPIPSSAHPAVTTPSPGLLLHLGFRSCSAPARPRTCRTQQEESRSPLPHPCTLPKPPMSRGRMRTQWSGLMGLSHPCPSTTWDECSPWGHSWDTHGAPHTDVTKGRLPVLCLQKPFGVGTIAPSSPTHPQLPSPQIYQRLKIFYTSP